MSHRCFVAPPAALLSETGNLLVQSEGIACDTPFELSFHSTVHLCTDGPAGPAGIYGVAEVDDSL